MTAAGWLLAAALLGGGDDLAAAADTAYCAVQRVIDGDTLVCRGGLRVRLLLIDCPETGRPFAREAREALIRLAPPGTLLALESDVQRLDRYGRTLAYLRMPDGRSVNEEMLRQGLAVVAVFPPNVRYVERYRAIADSARRAGRGVWAGLRDETTG